MMLKKIIPILLIIVAAVFSCSNNDTAPQSSNITFSFSHSWDGTPITNSDFNSIKFTNANREDLSITKLRYIVSKIIFTKSTGEDFIFEGYHLIDLTNTTSLNFSVFEALPYGKYTNVSFIFGLNNEDNYNNNYQDLNSASWNVPDLLGGGYHYMQLEGKFIDNTSTETGYAYHAIRAVDNSGASLSFEDTFFEVNLGEANITDNAKFNIEMNVAEWFKNPNTWDLNMLNNMLMPNFNAQILMFQNGQNVFSLKSIAQ
jgi:hypothetical protein